MKLGIVSFKTNRLSNRKISVHMNVLGRIFYSKGVPILIWVGAVTKSFHGQKSFIKVSFDNFLIKFFEKLL